jgi:hypothetical protein
LRRATGLCSRAASRRGQSRSRPWIEPIDFDFHSAQSFAVKQRGSSPRMPIIAIGIIILSGLHRGGSGRSNGMRRRDGCADPIYPAPFAVSGSILFVARCARPDFRGVQSLIAAPIMSRTMKSGSNPTGAPTCPLCSPRACSTRPSRCRGGTGGPFAWSDRPCAGQPCRVNSAAWKPRLAQTAPLSAAPMDTIRIIRLLP